MNEKTRKILHILCMVVCIAAALIMVYELAWQIIGQVLLANYNSMPADGGDIGIIGGADGPTAIVIGQKKNVLLPDWAWAGMVAALSGGGIYLTRKKK